MDKFSNLDTIDLNDQEMKNLNGGSAFGLALGLISLGIAVASVDWDQAADDFRRGWNSL
jgi:hypothetical protein